MGLSDRKENMSTVYRIEIDIRIDNPHMRTKVIQTAREDYRKSPFAWTLEDGKLVEISAEEFVVDTKTAFLELAESASRSALPGIEPDAFRCGIAEPDRRNMLKTKRNPIHQSRSLRPVTSEVAGSSPVVPAICFQ